MLRVPGYPHVVPQRMVVGDSATEFGGQRKVNVIDVS